MRRARGPEATAWEARNICNMRAHRRSQRGRRKAYVGDEGTWMGRRSMVRGKTSNSGPGGWIPVGLVVLAAFVIASGISHRLLGASMTEWPEYGADAGATKYSPLDQIN